jgi:hypothetical protein
LGLIGSADESALKCNFGSRLLNPLGFKIYFASKLAFKKSFWVQSCSKPLQGLGLFLPAEPAFKMQLWFKVFSNHLGLRFILQASLHLKNRFGFKAFLNLCKVWGFFCRQSRHLKCNFGSKFFQTTWV